MMKCMLKMLKNVKMLKAVKCKKKLNFDGCKSNVENVKLWKMKDKCWKGKMLEM